MNQPFDMRLFLAGVLTGSNSTRERHIRQAKAIQAAISVRWKIGSPWSWKRKHLAWYLAQFAEQHANSTTYYCLLTINLLCLRLGKSWKLNQANKIRPREATTATSGVEIERPVA